MFFFFLNWCLWKKLLICTMKYLAKYLHSKKLFWSLKPWTYRVQHVDNLEIFKGSMSSLILPTTGTRTIYSLAMQNEMCWPAAWAMHLAMCWKGKIRDFPGGPAAKTPCCQCRGPRFNPWSGNYIPHVTTEDPHAATKTWCSQIST